MIRVLNDLWLTKRDNQTAMGQEYRNGNTGQQAFKRTLCIYQAKPKKRYQLRQRKYLKIYGNSKDILGLRQIAGVKIGRDNWAGHPNRPLHETSRSYSYKLS